MSWKLSIGTNLQFCGGVQCINRESHASNSSEVALSI